MNEYQAAGAPMQKPPKGWFARNWWWFLALVILGPIFCCCGTCGGCFYLALSQMEKLPPYQDTLTAANSNAEVQAALGTPIEAAGLFETASSGGQFNYAQSGLTETLNAAVPVSGPNGSGMLYIDASTNGGVWTYSRREIVVNGSGQTIDLMPGGAGTPGINLPDPNLPGDNGDETPE